jgi:hypothetical protein
MDNLVETVVWVALVAGTAAVLLIELPRICIWCLEIVEKAQNIRIHKKVLQRTPPPDERPDTPDKVRIVYRNRP